jgi:hypothetical protein
MTPNQQQTPSGLHEATCSSFASIRRKQYPEYYMGWVPEYDAPKWTSYALDAAPVPLEILMDELNKVAAREVNVWAVIYPENANVGARIPAPQKPESITD